MSTAPGIAPSTRAAQFGERSVAVDHAWERGMAAVRELGLTAEITPLPRDRPGAWRCALLRDGAPVAHGLGWGKGTAPVARVGAVFEALEHHVSLGTDVPAGDVVLRNAHGVPAPGFDGDAALALLADGPDQPLACIPYRSLADGAEVGFPLFLSMPHYHDDARLRERLGDGYDYAGIARYSMNNGWAAGTEPDEALVHALNEIVERDAMSLLLVDQFLAPVPAPLTVIDPAGLPAALAELHRAAEARLGAPVWLLDMTTDLGIPACWAYTPAPTGEPARLRGCGASLSRYYAVERALTELIQLHSVESTQTERPPAARDFTAPYPPLHRCYLADLRAPLERAEVVPYRDTPSPATPADHLATLVAALRRRGYTPYTWRRHVTPHLAVVHVFVPGLERFMVITDGQLVLPGERGRAACDGRPG